MTEPDCSWRTEWGREEDPTGFLRQEMNNPPQIGLISGLAGRDMRHKKQIPPQIRLHLPHNGSIRNGESKFCLLLPPAASVEWKFRREKCSVGRESPPERRENWISRHPPAPACRKPEPAGEVERY
jgi:hypothetical protein